MMHQAVSVLLVLTVLLESATAARILGVFAHPIRSNSLYTHAVMDALAAAGHDVTVYSCFKPATGSGFKHIHIPPRTVSNMSYEDFLRIFSSGFGGRFLRIVAHKKSESFLSHEAVQQLLHSNETYDVVFTSASFGEESLLVFGHVFKAPTISLMPSGTWSAIDYIVGNSLSLAFAPEYSVYPFTDKMTLVERIQNVLSGVASLLLYHWYDLPGHDEILKRQTSALSPPPVYQMARDVALTFINVHPTVRYPKPLSPNVVMIGGIHIDAKSPPLPKDLQQIMDNAKEGVIFCSLGSMVPVDSMPRHLIEAFIQSFKKFPQMVIWKISAKSLPELSENVFVSSWLPQQSILEHPNLKVFFTHGGLGSQLEALRAGVPVVGLPYFTDQPHNIRQYEHLGMGVGLTLSSLSEESITTALQTVLNNSRYTENARRVARIYADRPMEPAASVVYWTEYILRHGGSNLRPHSAKMPWYQRALLDVVAVLLLGLTIIAFLSVRISQFIFHWMMRFIGLMDKNIKKKNL